MKKIFFAIFLSPLFLGCVSVEKNESSGVDGRRADVSTFVETSNRNSSSAEECESTVQQQRGDAIFTHSTVKGNLYHHEYYSFSYSEDDEQSEWVAYDLTREESYGKLKRGDHFSQDPIVITGSAHPYEYHQSGYTRGHLAPSADMRFEPNAMSECFYTSNISPQKAKFNAGIWNDLEMQVRYWAQKFGSVYVVTGPILTDANLEKMRYKNNRGVEEISSITVPNRFFKIVFDYSYEGKEKMIGFIIPQNIKAGDIFEYAVTVDSIETLTGLDFFQNIPISTQKKYESRLNVEAWKKFKFENKYNDR